MVRSDIIQKQIVTLIFESPSYYIKNKNKNKKKTRRKIVEFSIISNDNTIKQRPSFLNLSPYLVKLDDVKLQNDLFRIISPHRLYILW